MGGLEEGLGGWWEGGKGRDGGESGGMGVKVAVALVEGIGFFVLHLVGGAYVGVSFVRNMGVREMVWRFGKGSAAGNPQRLEERGGCSHS